MVNFLIGYLIVSLCCMPFIGYMIYTAPSIDDENYM